MIPERDTGQSDRVHCGVRSKERKDPKAVRVPLYLHVTDVHGPADELSLLHPVAAVNLFLTVVAPGVPSRGSSDGNK